MERNQSDVTFSATLVRLLQGVVYFDQTLLWNEVLQRRKAIAEYFATIGLGLFVDEVEGYAFLKSTPHEDDASGTSDGPTVTAIPRLVQRRALSYDLSLLLVLLREALEQFDAGATDDRRLVLSRAAIVEMLAPFFVERQDQTKQLRRFESAVQKAVAYGVLYPLKSDQDSFEVKRIIKAMVNANALEAIKQTLEKHVSESEEIA